jgi:hypothetical protein
MSNNILQRLALYATLGLLLSVMGFDAFGWQFWAVAAMFWASELLTRRETKDWAMAEGITAYLNMTPEEQNDIKKIHQQATRELDEQ